MSQFSSENMLTPGSAGFGRVQDQLKLRISLRLIKIWNMDVSKTIDHMQIIIKIQNPKSGRKGHGCSLHLQNQYRAKIWIMGVSKTSDHIQIKIKMPKPSQEYLVSCKASNEDLKDIDVLCTFKIKTES